jgi:hypothetical protein
METVSKIDIMVESIFCYDELENTMETIPLTQEYDFFMNTFSDNQDLLTVNIYNPIPRIIKFYGIVDSRPDSFVEINYDTMTISEKESFDNFVTLIKSK